KPLEDLTANKGETVPLEIELDKKPKEIKWYKNGQEIKPGDKEQPKKVSDTKYQLVVPDVDADGQFKVVAISDDDVPSDSGCKLTVKLPAKPGLKFVKPLEDLTANKGETVPLEIELDGKPKEVKWYKNGQEIKPGDKEQPKKVSDTKYQLVVPDFVKPLEDLTANKGETVPLEIELDGKPKEVKWYKNGQEIKPGDKEQPKKISDTKYQLVVPDVDADGQFKVVVTNEDDVPADSSCKLTVKLPAKPGLKFIKPLEDVTATKGETVPLEVELDGKPKEIKWEKDGKEVKPGDKEQPKKVSDTKYQLVIPDVDADGKFKVVATNDDDVPTDSSCKLTVKLPAEPKLTFLKPLKDTEVVEGQSAEFEVETNAEPKIVKWYKNGQEIKPTDVHFQIKKVENTKFKLVIPKADKNDAGTFKIVLENDSGPVDSSANLTVKTGAKNPPKITKGLEDTAVAKGDALIFEVKIDGDVDTIRWLKDGQ
uniref:Ig-like domain-containing protein n=1 Tax=Panagrolaimus sp. JU765 TaxID=591449 RepID=A0AC34R8M1_9BILA